MCHCENFDRQYLLNVGMRGMMKETLEKKSKRFHNLNIYS
jgi:hypothetical protein